MQYNLNIVLRQLPDSLNKSLRGNRMMYFSKNKRWDALIFAHTRNKLPKAPLQKAHIRIVRHFYRTLDYDGLVGSLKPIVDGLVFAGVLADDTWKVTGAWEIDQQFRPKKSGPMLEIIVSERVL